MSNPLMRVMLENILVKEGKMKPASSSARADTSPGAGSIHLNKEQQSLLIKSVLKDNSKATYDSRPAAENSSGRMITLEALRGDKKTSPTAETERKVTASKTMVTLASIGKLAKKD